MSKHDDLSHHLEWRQCQLNSLVKIHFVELYCAHDASWSWGLLVFTTVFHFILLYNQFVLIWPSTVVGEPHQRGQVFEDKKIHSMSSYGREVKPTIPYNKFMACTIIV